MKVIVKSIALKIVTALLLFPVWNFAQQMSLPYEGYFHAPVIYSPGASAHEEHFNFHLAYQDYWRGFEGSPEAINLFGYGRVAENMGVSFRLSNTAANVLGQTQLEGGYAYLLQLDEKSYIAPGVSFGLRWLNARETNNPMNEIDPVLGSVLFSQTLYSIGFGVSYRRDRLSVELSAPELYYNQEYMTQVFSMASYRFSTSYDIDLTPMVMYRKFSPVRGDFQGRLKAQYKDVFYLELGYGNDVRLIGGAGFILKDFRVGYMYFNQNTIMNGTNTIYMSYQLKYGNRKAQETSGASQ